MCHVRHTLISDHNSPTPKSIKGDHNSTFELIYWLFQLKYVLFVPLLKPTPSFNYKLKLFSDNLTLLAIIILLGLHLNKKFHC